MTTYNRNMYPNVWNIKEILSISNGGTKSSSVGGPTSDYSSLTDSQFLFGSQFWPDQIQGLSQEFSFQSKNSQQNSQEVNEPKISTNYHTKPFLFGGDGKDKSKVPSFTSNKNKGVLDNFEEDKRKAKEKSESEVVMSELLQLKQCMEHMKIALSSVEGKIDSAKKEVVEGLDALRKTVQDTVGSMREGCTVQLEAVQSDLNSQAQTLREVADRDTRTVSEMAALKSCLHSLQRELESLSAGQSREQSVMEEALSLLQTWVSSQRPGTSMADSAVQTSPCPFERLCLVSEEKRYIQGLQLCSGLAMGTPGEVACMGLPHSDDKASGEISRSCSPVRSTEKERAETPAAGQRSYPTRSAVTHRADVRNTGDSTRQRNMAAVSCYPPTSRLVAERVRRSDGFSGMGEKRARETGAVRGIHNTSHRLKNAHNRKTSKRRGCRTWPSKRRKALSLAQNQRIAVLQADSEAIGGTGDTWLKQDTPTSEHADTNFNPCGMWSQDSSGSQLLTGYETTMASWVLPLCEPKSEITQKGLWQLFDMGDDSD
ncbi:hypothetical protein MATL_G00074140 [Megalops atlanticus]|uniref:Uncharacterized protein n=1 Tax=Megalops atlanticus TaxID=7932 RepID=A0A9D3QAC8_MEGAT|nr:hypothetical protein MATL_G00074140 [Megalops atlanticus]